MLSLFLAQILENFDDPTKIKDEDDDHESSVLQNLQGRLFWFLRLVSRKIPFIEICFSLSKRLKQIENYLTNSSEELDSADEESGHLEFTKSLHVLSNLHEFESE